MLFQLQNKIKCFSIFPSPIIGYWLSVVAWVDRRQALCRKVPYFIKVYPHVPTKAFWTLNRLVF